MRGLIFSLVLIGLIVPVKANQTTPCLDSLLIETNTEYASIELVMNDSLGSRPKVKFKRGKAIIFTVLTGLLGGHRIYLGTHHRTPIIYSVTLGGLGILPFVDLINLIFTKDISKFEDKSQIIMWGD